MLVKKCFSCHLCWLTASNSNLQYIQVFLSKIHPFDDLYKLYLVTVYSSVIQSIISRVTLGGINPRSRSNAVTFVDCVNWIAKDSGGNRTNERISSRDQLASDFHQCVETVNHNGGVLSLPECEMKMKYLHQVKKIETNSFSVFAPSCHLWESQPWPRTFCHNAISSFQETVKGLFKKKKKKDYF